MEQDIDELFETKTTLQNANFQFPIFRSRISIIIKQDKTRKKKKLAKQQPHLSENACFAKFPCSHALLKIEYSPRTKAAYAAINRLPKQELHHLKVPGNSQLVAPPRRTCTPLIPGH